jgi:hypothetical protein
MAPHSATRLTLPPLPGPHLPHVDGLGCPSLEVEILTDEVALRDERVVRVTTLRLVSAAPSSSAPPPPSRPPLEAVAPREPRPDAFAPLIGATCWEQITVKVIDGHTVRIGRGKHVLRRTYGDLGLFAKNSREPTKKWKTLLAICAAHGELRRDRFTGRGAMRQAVHVLRGRLKEAFGLEEDPFHDWENGWRTRFCASSEIAEEDE